VPGDERVCWLSAPSQINEQQRRDEQETGADHRKRKKEASADGPTEQTVIQQRAMLTQYNVL